MSDTVFCNLSQRKTYHTKNVVCRNARCGILRLLSCNENNNNTKNNNTKNIVCHNVLYLILHSASTLCYAAKILLNKFNIINKHSLTIS